MSCKQVATVKIKCFQENILSRSKAVWGEATEASNPRKTESLNTTLNDVNRSQHPTPEPDPAAQNGHARRSLYHLGEWIPLTQRCANGRWLNFSMLFIHYSHGPPDSGCTGCFTMDTKSQLQWTDAFIGFDNWVAAAWTGMLNQRSLYGRSACDRINVCDRIIYFDRIIF